MPNVATILKQEISRVARKEVHSVLKSIAPALSALKRKERTEAENRPA